MLILVVVLGIVFGLALPTLGDGRMMRLREAARMLAADIEFAQSECVAHGDDLRLVKFDTTANPHRYWVATASAPNTPVTDPSNQQPLLTAFGSGRASGTAGVSIQSASSDVLILDAYGAPANDATIRLGIQSASGMQTLTVQVKAGSGEVTVQ